MIIEVYEYKCISYWSDWMTTYPPQPAATLWELVEEIKGVTGYAMEKQVVKIALGGGTVIYYPKTNFKFIVKKGRRY